MSNQTVRDAYPWFMFARRSDIERQCGFLLAGRLFLDTPRRKGAALPKSASPEVQFIVEELIEAAESGELPDNGLTFGWRGPVPANAVDIDDDALMQALTASSSN